MALFSNESIVHAWANGIDECHIGRNVSHLNGCLYSHDTCVAQRICVGDRTVFILSTQKYSSSTSRLQNLAVESVPNGADVFFFRGVELHTQSFIVTESENPEYARRTRVMMGLEFIAEELQNCKDMRTSVKVSPAFSYNGYDEMLRWFSLTGFSSVRELMDMRLRDFSRFVPSFRWLHTFDRVAEIASRKDAREVKRMLKLMVQRTPVEKICDLINGNGTWEAYLSRTKKQRSANSARKKERKKGGKA